MTTTRTYNVAILVVDPTISDEDFKTEAEALATAAGGTITDLGYKEVSTQLVEQEVAVGSFTIDL
jgi:hypothetical protein